VNGARRFSTKRSEVRFDAEAKEISAVRFQATTAAATATMSHLVPRPTKRGASRSATEKQSSATRPIFAAVGSNWR
jgi:hypothetical protein